MYTSLESLAGDDFLSPELKKKYAAGRILGRGACGEVRLVYEIVSKNQFQNLCFVMTNFTGINVDIYFVTMLPTRNNN